MNPAFKGMKNTKCMTTAKPIVSLWEILNFCVALGKTVQ